jgi:uncharacterized protein (TIGR00645 family)
MSLSPLDSTRPISAQVDEAIRARMDALVSEIIASSVEAKAKGALKEKIDYSVEGKVSRFVSEEIDRSRKWTFEHLFEDRIIFNSRWILAPAYFFLIFVLLGLCVKVAEETSELFFRWKLFDQHRALAQALNVVDVVLVMNLILMVLFVGYINFVSKIHPSRSEDWPDWTSHLDYSGLKLQLLGSVIAISAISLLAKMIDISEAQDVNSSHVLLMLGIHITFVISALAIAVVNKLKVATGTDAASQREAAAH